MVDPCRRFFPPDFPSDMTMLAWVVLRVPCLCLPVLASFSFPVLFCFGHVQLLVYFSCVPCVTSW